jgi:small subunit ribosomal protein S11
MKSTPTKKKNKRVLVRVGIAHVKAGHNNTIITITDPSGKTISWSSAGKVNFSGSKKGSAFAANVAAQDAGKIAEGLGVKEISVRLQGIGLGRDSAVRGLASAGLTITAISDCTPVPHNGCRPPKVRSG